MISMGLLTWSNISEKSTATTFVLGWLLIRKGMWTVLIPQARIHKEHPVLVEKSKRGRFYNHTVVFDVEKFIAFDKLLKNMTN